MPTIKERIKAHRFFSGEKATDAPIRLNHRRIFIVPTQRGFNFVLLMTLLLLIAFVYNNNLAYLLAFLLASIFFVTILHTFRSLSGLILQQGRNNAVFLGEAAGFALHVTNPTGLDRINVQIALDKSASVNIRINRHSQIDVMLYSATRKRGWHQAGKVTISSTFPLGLFRAWSPIRFDMKVLVYPKPAHFSRAFPETPAAQSGQGGVNKKDPDEFYGLQDYQSGDSIKQIHWKAFAKGLGLFSKQYGGQNSAEIWLDYEQAPGNTVEERLSCLCRWVIEAEQAGIYYGFRLPGLRLSPDRGFLHSRKCLESLALF